MRAAAGARARRRCRACASATNASSKMPRAMPAWLVTTTTAKPARLSRRIASTVYGKEREPLEPIEVADLLDERAVAIEEDGGPHVMTAAVAAASRDGARTTRPTVMRFMQR